MYLKLLPFCSMIFWLFDDFLLTSDFSIFLSSEEYVCMASMLYKYKNGWDNYISTKEKYKYKKREKKQKEKKIVLNLKRVFSLTQKFVLN